MSNSATAGTTHNIAGWPSGALKSASFTVDTVQSALALAAAPGAGYKHVVVGGWAKNGHASGAQTVQLRSGASTVIAQETLTAGTQWDINKVRGIGICDENDALNVYAADATNQPITGRVFYITIGVNDPIPLPVPASY